MSLLRRLISEVGSLFCIQLSDISLHPTIQRLLLAGCIHLHPGAPGCTHFSTHPPQISRRLVILCYDALRSQKAKSPKPLVVRDFGDCTQSENDEAKLKQLIDVYRHIRAKLDDLLDAGELNTFTRKVICTMTIHVLTLIAKNYQKVREGVEHIMGGKVLEYEAKTIWNEGRDEGISIGLDRGRNEERQLAQAETEERAKDMLRDRMELSLIEKYTHLSMPRIQELARGLGML